MNMGVLIMKMLKKGQHPIIENIKINMLINVTVHLIVWAQSIVHKTPPKPMSVRHLRNKCFIQLLVNFALYINSIKANIWFIGSHYAPPVSYCLYLVIPDPLKIYNAVTQTVWVWVMASCGVPNSYLHCMQFLLQCFLTNRLGCTFINGIEWNLFRLKLILVLKPWSLSLVSLV